MWWCAGAQQAKKTQCRTAQALQLFVHCIHLFIMAEDLPLFKRHEEEIYSRSSRRSLHWQKESLIPYQPGQYLRCIERVNWLWWVGFYQLSPIQDEDELVLGPFQGPIACTRTWVFAAALAKPATTLVVPDVEKFPGHIACSSLSKKWNSGTCF